MATLDDPGSSHPDHSRPAVAEPRLFDGQRLDQPAFHEIYSEMPEDFRAELIDGVVHLMNMPLHEDHAGPDSLMIGFLVAYSIETPGTSVRNNITTKLGPRSEVQPDSCLLIEPAHGGRILRDGKGMLINSPELVVEISSSTLRLDLNAKKRVYELAGTLEYVVYDASDQKIHWFRSIAGHFEPMPSDSDGLIRSKAFPGLWVDEAAFASNDGRGLFATLRRGLQSPEHADFVEQLRLNRANRPNA